MAAWNDMIGNELVACPTSTPSYDHVRILRLLLILKSKRGAWSRMPQIAARRSAVVIRRRFLLHFAPLSQLFAIGFPRATSYVLQPAFHG